VIGRSKECQLRPGCNLVSRRHCVISLEDGRLLVEDLRSTNGTFVNGEKVDSTRELMHGDHLNVGTMEFEVRLFENLVKEAESETVIAREPSISEMAATLQQPLEDRSAIEKKIIPDAEKPNDFATESKTIDAESEEVDAEPKHEDSNLEIDNDWAASGLHDAVDNAADDAEDDAKPSAPSEKPAVTETQRPTSKKTASQEPTAKAPRENTSKTIDAKPEKVATKKADAEPKHEDSNLGIDSEWAASGLQDAIDIVMDDAMESIPGEKPAKKETKETKAQTSQNTAENDELDISNWFNDDQDDAVSDSDEDSDDDLPDTAAMSPSKEDDAKPRESVTSVTSPQQPTRHLSKPAVKKKDCSQTAATDVLNMMNKLIPKKGR
jgi:pSer/pThr/pTyr-binding forkhead associated (FHA) protein